MLGLNRSASALSNSFFRGLPSCLHLIHNSTLFLAFCFCSFLLHVVAIYICIFLVSCQLVELSALPKFHSFCGKKNVYPIVLLKNFISIDVSCSLFICLRVQISIPYRRMGTGSTLSTYFLRSLDQSWFKSVV